MHCDFHEDTGKLRIRPHFIEEFPQIIRRWGLWKGDVEVFARAAAAQLTLDEAGESRRAAHRALEEMPEDFKDDVRSGRVQVSIPGADR